VLASTINEATKQIVTTIARLLAIADAWLGMLPRI
jgi:hypothetical protein